MQTNDLHPQSLITPEQEAIAREQAGERAQASCEQTVAIIEHFSEHLSLPELLAAMPADLKNSAMEAFVADIERGPSVASRDSFWEKEAKVTLAGENPAQKSPEITPEKPIDKQEVKKQLEVFFRGKNIQEAERKAILEEVSAQVDVINAHRKELREAFSYIAQKDLPRAYAILTKIASQYTRGTDLIRKLALEVRSQVEGVKVYQERRRVLAIFEAAQVLEPRQGFFQLPGLEKTWKQSMKAIFREFSEGCFANPKAMQEHLAKSLETLNQKIYQQYQDHRQMGSYEAQPGKGVGESFSTTMTSGSVAPALFALDRIKHAIHTSDARLAQKSDKDLYVESLEGLLDLRNTVRNMDLMLIFENNVQLLRSGIERAYEPQLREGVFCEAKHPVMLGQLRSISDRYEQAKKQAPQKMQGEYDLPRYHAPRSVASLRADHEQFMESRKQGEIQTFLAQHRAGITRLEHEIAAHPENPALKEKLRHTREAFYTTEIAWRREDFDREHHGCFAEDGKQFTEHLRATLSQEPNETITLDDKKYRASEILASKDLFAEYLARELTAHLMRFQATIEKPLFLLLKNRYEADMAGKNLGVTPFDESGARMLGHFQSLFDPTSETFALSIRSKRVLAEEALCLPLTAFLVSRVGTAVRALSWMQKAIKGRWFLKYGAYLASDAAEGTLFDVLNQYRQRRGHGMMDYLVSKEFYANAGASSIMFLAFRGSATMMRPVHAELGLEGKGIMKTIARESLDFANDLGIYTAGDALLQQGLNNTNVFAENAFEKIFSNVGIVGLVKLGYRARDFAERTVAPRVPTQPAPAQKQHPQAMHAAATLQAAQTVAPEVRRALGMKEVQPIAKKAPVHQETEQRDMEGKGSVPGAELHAPKPTADDLIRMLERKVLLDAMTGFPRGKGNKVTKGFEDLQKDMKSLQSTGDIHALAKKAIDTEISEYIKRNNLKRGDFSQEQIEIITEKGKLLADDFAVALKEKYLKDQGMTREFDAKKYGGKNIESLMARFANKEVLSGKVQEEMRKDWYKDNDEKINPEKQKEGSDKRK